MKSTFKYLLTAGTLALGLTLGGGMAAAAPASAAPLTVGFHSATVEKSYEVCASKFAKKLHEARSNPLKWNIHRIHRCTWDANMQRYYGYFDYTTWRWAK